MESHKSVVHAGHTHPSAMTYIIIGVVLTILTAVEIGVYYVPSLTGVLIPLLFVLAAVKFFFVVGWYMHLRFDSKILTWVFLGGLFTAMAMLSGVFALFNGWGG